MANGLQFICEHVRRRLACCDAKLCLPFIDNKKLNAKHLVSVTRATTVHIRLFTRVASGVGSGERKWLCDLKHHTTKMLRSACPSLPLSASCCPLAAPGSLRATVTASAKHSGSYFRQGGARLRSQTLNWMKSKCVFLQPFITFSPHCFTGLNLPQLCTTLVKGPSHVKSLIKTSELSLMPAVMNMMLGFSSKFKLNCNTSTSRLSRNQSLQLLGCASTVGSLFGRSLWHLDTS